MFLVWIPPFLRVEYESDFNVGGELISDEIVEANSENREKFWRFWRAYCKTLGIDPYLEEVDLQTKKRVAAGFVGRVRKCSHGRVKQVKVGTVR